MFLLKARHGYRDQGQVAVTNGERRAIRIERIEQVIIDPQGIDDSEFDAVPLPRLNEEVT